MSYFPVNHVANTRVSPTPAQSASKHNYQLRICLLGYRSHPHVGGQGIYLQYLSKALVELGHEVDVISGPPYPELDARVGLIQLPSLDLYAVKEPFKALRWKHLRSFTDVYEWWGKISGGFAEPYTFGRRLINYFRQQQKTYDIVHDNQSLCFGLLALQKMGIPVIATVHHPITRDRDLALAAATGWGHKLLVKRWYSFLTMQKKVVQNLNHILTVSEQSRRDIAGAFDRPTHKIHIIPNGIDTTIFKPQPNVQRDSLQLITTASSDQPLKGLSVLLRALAAVRKTYPDIKLVVIGKLKPEGATERELQQLKLTDCVNFISGVTTEEIVSQYAQACISIVPSLYEGFGLPAGEAMACGVPLICSDGGALPEVVGDAAYMVKAGDVAELERALLELLQNPAQRDLLGERGRTHIQQQLSWQVVAQQMTQYYQQIITRQFKPSPTLTNAEHEPAAINAYVND